MRAVSSWGRLEAAQHAWVALADLPQAGARLPRATGPGLAYGNGRSYGDVCLNPGGTLWHTGGLDRFIAFDPQTGHLACEAGVLLRDILRLMIPRGWTLPVTPGTHLVTVGGAIANDVHGKNHHRAGCFGDHVAQLSLLRTDGERIDCGPAERADWFAATVGGLGLTGVITQAVLKLRRTPGPWLYTESLPYASLAEFFALADSSQAGWEHTVSWIDCMAGPGRRGLFLRANASDTGQGAAPAPAARTMPLTPPVSLVNRLTVGAFNPAYFHLGRWRAGRRVVHYEPFMVPLDRILEWNRIYGPRGFYQYQCVVPRKDGADATEALLAAVAAAGAGSFLAVLKTFGDRPAWGMLSFPMPGTTLALDFANRGTDSLRLFTRLDAIVREAGGRIYPAKDARMPRAMFEAGYPRLAEFTAYRDPGISSALSRRLMGS